MQMQPFVPDAVSANLAVTPPVVRHQGVRDHCGGVFFGGEAIEASGGLAGSLELDLGSAPGSAGGLVVPGAAPVSPARAVFHSGGVPGELPEMSGNLHEGSSKRGPEEPASPLTFMENIGAVIGLPECEAGPRAGTEPELAIPESHRRYEGAGGAVGELSNLELEMLWYVSFKKLRLNRIGDDGEVFERDQNRKWCHARW